jgi:hypothetical protein
MLNGIALRLGVPRGAEGAWSYLRLPNMTIMYLVIH